MGVVPLQFLDGDSVASLGLTGCETFAIEGLAGLTEDGWPSQVTVRVEVDGRTRGFPVRLRIDTATEAKYLRHGGVLPFVARTLVRSTSAS
jgi:aconitate hydratase